MRSAIRPPVETSARLPHNPRVDTPTAQKRSPVLHRALNQNYPIAVRGEGPWLFDAEGKRYLDFASSAVVNFIGHGDPVIASVIADQAARLEFAHSSNFTTEIAEQFAGE